MHGGTQPTRIAILMATYNGAKFIREQIESIQKQTWRDWHLIIRDDGSGDLTPAIIEAFAEQDKRISLLTDTKKNKGPAENFFTLSAHALKSGYEYFMYADQDDVWRKDKIELSISSMRKVEEEHGKQYPLLIHTDMQVTDDALNIIHQSHMRYRGGHHTNKRSMNTLLVQNFVTGCSMACNRALLILATPAPGYTIMHDWWLALCASLYGEIIYRSERTLLYRQHDMNRIGAHRHKYIPNPFRLNLPTLWTNGRRHFENKIRQARTLRNLADIRTSPIPQNEETLERFLFIYNTRNTTKRLIRTYRTHLDNQTGMIRKLIMLTYIVSCEK